MKTAPFTIMALSLALSAGALEALELQPGQSIGVDFGATSPTNHFNPWDPSNPATPADGILTTVMDTTGTTLPGIGILFGGTLVQSVAGTTQDIANNPGFDISNIEDAVTGYDLTMTFTGLTPGQGFTLRAVSSYASNNIGAEFVWNTEHIVTDSTSTSGGTLALFTDIVADANGRIFLKALSQNSLFISNWSGVNAALLTANSVPEPSVGIFLFTGMGGWIFALRLRSKRA